jgi:anaerobic magnesium-protoporphyrin IX monomethyl ester cyclase
MKIVLINPYMTIAKHVHGLKKHRAWIPPLGLGYLKSFADKHSAHKVEIIDCVGQSCGKVSIVNGVQRIGLLDGEIEECLRKSAPDAVGISASFTPFYEDSLNIARLSKRVLPQSMVIMGGSHATIDYNNVIKDEPVDIVVRGDGEETLLELMNNIDAGDFINTKGTVVKAGGKVIVNDIRSPIQDLDSIPFPSYDGMNIEYYFGRDEKGLVRRFLNEPVGSVMSSRGCRYNCIFCATDKVFKHFRARTPGNVVDEIERLVKECGVREIAFHDDCFLASKERVQGICHEILKRGIKIRWHAAPGMSVWLLDEELLKLMHKAGLYRAALTIESGCDETLKFIRKKVNLGKAKEIIRICNRLGIRVGANFIIGFPYERPEHIDQTRRYIMAADLDTVSILLSQPLKGAELFDIYEHEGLMPKEGPLLSSSIFRTRYGSNFFTADQLNGIAESMRHEFQARLKKKIRTPSGFYYHVLTKLNTTDKIGYAFKKTVLRMMH